MNNNTELQDSIIDRLGCETWADVVGFARGFSEAEIREELNSMFPNDGNIELAWDIYTAVNA